MYIKMPPFPVFKPKPNKTYTALNNLDFFQSLLVINWLLYAFVSEIIRKCQQDLLIKHQNLNIRRTKSQNSNVSRLVFHLSLPNLMKPGVR